MQEQNEFEEKPKKYRVARFYRNGKMSYDLFMNLSEKVKRISATKIREIVEGCNESEFASLKVDDEAGRYEVELWKGQRDSVSGHMESSRILDVKVDADISNLIASELTTNCFAIKNNSEAVAQVAERLFEFVKQQGNKPKKI